MDQPGLFRPVTGQFPGVPYTGAHDMTPRASAPILYGSRLAGYGLPAHSSGAAHRPWHATGHFAGQHTMPKYEEKVQPISPLRLTEFARIASGVSAFTGNVLTPAVGSSSFTRSNKSLPSLFGKQT